MEEYKAACLKIDKEMLVLSQRIKLGEIDVASARSTAHAFISQLNPWKYVNIHSIEKHTLVDLSTGGIHHSWEEDKKNNPLGNVLLEVQQDRMDPISTIRAFDRGKIKDDGSIRKIHVEDYFRLIDTDPKRNNLLFALKKPQGKKLLFTPLYSLEIVEIEGPQKETQVGPFSHLYVRAGRVNVSAPDGNVTLAQGHSCFVFKEAGDYTITPLVTNSVIIKTFIN